MMKDRLLVCLLALSVAPLAACSSSPAGGACAGTAKGAPMTIPILPMGTHISGVGSMPNFQTATAKVTVPAGCYSSIVVTYNVHTLCNTGTPPPGENWPTMCDPFDRLTRVSLADSGSKTPLVLVDAVTPFGGDQTYTQDVTDYAPALEGTHTYAILITSYADSTGMASGTDAGFDVDATLTLTPGTPPHDVVGVVPVFDQSIDSTTKQPLSAMVTAPAGAAHARLDFFTSGHGAVGPNVCDEFCMKENDVSVDGANVYAMSPWKDCSDNCTHVSISGSFSCGGSTMPFTYYCKQNPTACPSSATFPRANWCPSQIIAPIPIPLPDADASGTHTLGVSVVNVQGNFAAALNAVYYR